MNFFFNNKNIFNILDLLIKQSKGPNFTAGMLKGALAEGRKKK
jgi:hypothetical protein